MILKNGYVYTSEGFIKKDIAIIDGIVFDLESEKINSCEQNLPDSNNQEVFDISDKYVVPGFVDVHVHFREPGFSYKETISTGSAAAARGGYTTVCTMPNLSPTPATLEGVKVQLAAIEKDAKVKVIPYGSITLNQNGKVPLSDMSTISEYVFAFTDDGKGVQDSELMEQAMNIAKNLGKVIVAHCEDESLLTGGYIHEGNYATQHNHLGISSESEWEQVKRDIELSEVTGCQYHVCHVSTKESIDLIREAKKRGAKVSCEVTPHHLLLSEEDLQEDGKYKMNPPLRTKEDKSALIQGIKDGTIDMIATDHAPHSDEEKSRGLKGSAMGIVGLEFAFSLLYTEFVLKEVITIDHLIKLMTVNPRKIFSLDKQAENSIDKGIKTVETGMIADLTVLDLNTNYTIDSSTFYSKGKSTPFDGMSVRGDISMTIVDGKVVYNHY